MNCGEAVLASEAISDTAALAAIGAAARELKLPTVRADAARMAEIAVRERQTHLAYLAEILSAEIDGRTGRRRIRRIAEARSPRIKGLADFNPFSRRNRSRQSFPATPGYLRSYPASPRWSSAVSRRSCRQNLPQPPAQSTKRYGWSTCRLHLCA